MCTGVTLTAVPTARRRHALTETPPVHAALEELRAEVGSDRIDLPELVVLGAREKLARLRAQDAVVAAGRGRLAVRIRERRVPVDPAAAEEVRSTGWARR